MYTGRTKGEDNVTLFNTHTRTNIKNTKSEARTRNTHGIAASEKGGGSTSVALIYLWGYDSIRRGEGREGGTS